MKDKTKKNVRNKNSENSAVAAASGNIMPWLLVAVVAVFAVFEILGPILGTAIAVRKPDMITHWKLGGECSGITSVYLYGNNLYVMDSTRGILLKYGAMSGRLLAEYRSALGILSMAQLSNGDVLVLSPGSRVLRFINGSAGNMMEPVVLEGCSNAGSIAVDSKDNVLALDVQKNIVFKYDVGLKRISEFGKGVIKSGGRVFIGPEDSAYVLDYSPKGKLYVEIFSNKGKLTGKFKALESKLFLGYESLAITAKGGVYINEMGKSRILYFSKNGALLASFGTASDNTSIISYPAGICGGSDGKFVIPSYEMLVMKNIK